MKTRHHITVGRKSPGNPVCRTIRFGADIQAIICYPKSRRSNRSNTRGKGRIISLRFNPKQFTLAEAKAWAKSKGYSVIKTAAAGTTQKKTPAKKSTRTRTAKARSAQSRASKAAPVCKISGCKTRIRKKKGPGRAPTKCAKHRRAVAKRKSRTRKNRVRRNPSKVRIKPVHKGILEVPKGKTVSQLPVRHFVNIAKRNRKKNFSKVSRALTNLEVWNKNRNKTLSRWAKGMKSKVKAELAKKNPCGKKHKPRRKRS